MHTDRYPDNTKEHFQTDQTDISMLKICVNLASSDVLMVNYLHTK